MRDIGFVKEVVIRCWRCGLRKYDDFWSVVFGEEDGVVIFCGWGLIAFA